MFPNGSTLDFSLSKHLAACHKETQTSNTELVDSSTATASGSVDTNDKASLKVFEFNELVQDPHYPKNITIIKDVFAEEVHNHSTDSHTDEAQSNRYTYCREVIRPYLKDYPANCPVSDEQLIRDALIAAQQDFPDYQPCFEIYRDDDDMPDQQDSNKSCNLRPSNRDCSPGIHGRGSDKSKENVPDNTSSDIIIYESDSQKKLKTSIIKKENKKGQSQFNIPSVEVFNNTLTSNMDSDKDGCPPKVRDPKCPKKVEKNPSAVCELDKNLEKPGPPSLCKGREEVSAATCKSNPTATPCQEETQGENSAKGKGRHQKINETPSVLSKNSLTSSSIFDDVSKSVSTPVETLNNIKIAFGDFFGKVYQTTKDAVCLIKTESTKHFSQKSRSNCDTLTPTSIQINESDTVSSCSLIDYQEDAALKEKEAEKEIDGHVFGNSEEQVVEHLLESVGSTLSVLGENMGIEKADARKLEEYNNRSPYDTVNTDTEAPARHLDTVNNVFTNIKSKIISMFNEYDEENSQDKKPNLSGVSSLCDEHSMHSIRRR